MLISADAFAVLALALVFDAVIGDPDWLWRRLPHPVALIGRVIGFMERRFNRPAHSSSHRKFAGFCLALGLVAGGAGLGFVLGGLRLLPAGSILVALAASVLLAQNSLSRHVRAVATALRSDLAAGRHAVSMIVGRDPLLLDEAGVARAAIESNAENFSDGLVAPVFWFAIGGLPGLLAYKALNTADSMIGHRGKRYAAFGWASARLDDLANFLPARLAGVLVCLAAPIVGATPRLSARVMMRDARRLASPNAGWPEAAMAGALGLSLAGPRIYEGGIVEGAWLNEHASNKAQAGDIIRSVRLGWAAWAILAFAILAAAAATTFT